MNVKEALNALSASDHGFMGKEECDEISKALGIAKTAPLQEEIDTRWDFKGLTIYEDKEDGFLDLAEFRKWMKDNWYWIGGHVKKGTTQTGFVDTLWMMYTQPDPDGYGLKGVPYTSGIDATNFACWCCRQLGVKYQSYMGRGFQLRGCVEALTEHFFKEEPKEVQANA